MKSLKRVFGTLISHIVEPIVTVSNNHKVHSLVSGVEFTARNYQIKSPVVVTGQKYIKIGVNFSSGPNFRIQAIDEYAGESFSPSICIGDNVTIQDCCHIGCIDSVTVGDGTLMGSNVLIIDHNHGYFEPCEKEIIPVMRRLSHKPVKIGRNVWLGDGVRILPGVELGDNVIVGANAVVTHSFPSDVVLAGIPAIVIRTL